MYFLRKEHQTLKINETIKQRECKNYLRSFNGVMRKGAERGVPLCFNIGINERHHLKKNEGVNNSIKARINSSI